MSTATINPAPASELERPFGEQALADTVTQQIDPLGPSTDPLSLATMDAAKAATDAAQMAASQNALLAGTQVTDAGLPTPQGNSTGAKIVRAAQHYLGVPYVWGGDSANGVDCSGLVQLAYKAAGINLPRISFQQANAGTRVSLRILRPGDLVAWDNSARNNGADHIAIYLGGGRILEAAHPGTKVRIRFLGKNEGAYGVRMGW